MRSEGRAHRRILRISLSWLQALAATKTAKLPRVFFSFDDMIKWNDVGNFPVRILSGLAHATALVAGV